MTAAATQDPPEAIQRLLSKVRLRNGTHKTTYPHRLDDVNERLAAWLPALPCVDILDAGISWGTATLEWHDQLTRLGVRHRMTATDLAIRATLTSWGRYCTVMSDQGGEPLLLKFGGLMLPLGSERLLARLSRPALGAILRAFCATALRAAPVEKGRCWKVEAISLVNPALDASGQVSVMEDDITVAGRFTAAFDVVRVANLVQKVYFDDATIRAIGANLRDRLRDGGVLVIVRTTEDGVNHATIFRRTAQQLAVCEQINGGSEVSELMCSLSSKTS